MQEISPFHLAIQVEDLEKARIFYGKLLGCEEGRSAEHWVDFNFFGHQLVCHQVQSRDIQPQASNPVDDRQVPVPHFGVVLEMDEWHSLATRLKAANTTFIIEPYIRFQGEPGEQATMFFQDPGGNALEFKAFRDRQRQLFAK